MKYIAVTLFVSILLIDAVIGNDEKVQARDKRSTVSKVNGKDRAKRIRKSIPHEGLINPADLGMRMKSRRSDPFRRAPRMKRFRRMAEDAEMFKRGISGGKHIRVKKADKA